MADGGIAALVCTLVCFLGFSSSTPGRMVFAAQGNHSVQVESSSSSSTTTTTSAAAAAAGTAATWCIVKPSTSQMQLDLNIQYCCTKPGVDCSLIQPNGTCYLPPNKISDASVVMNLYYNAYGKNPNNCDFSGTGLTLTTDPSVDKCIYRA